MARRRWGVKELRRGTVRLQLASEDDLHRVFVLLTGQGEVSA